MKKVIIGITSIVLCLSICALSYFYIEYKSYSKSGKDVKEVENNINKTNEEINKKKEEIETIKKENGEKVEILETWKKEIKKVKKDS